MKTRLTLVPPSSPDRHELVDARRWLDGQARAVTSGSFGPGWFDADDQARVYFEAGEAQGAPLATPFVVHPIVGGIEFAAIPKEADDFEPALLALGSHELWRAALRGAMALESACAYIVAQARGREASEAEADYRAALADLLLATAKARARSQTSTSGLVRRPEWTTRAGGAHEQGARHGTT